MTDSSAHKSTSIHKVQVMPLLLEACPSFGDAWAAHRTAWGDEPLLYIDLAAFARHLVGLMRQDQVSELPAVFTVIERLHTEGDSYVQEAATVGLLEDIQNIAPNEQVDPASFLRYLNPETTRWWTKLNDFWSRR
jgi:hypothetical protein